MPSRKTELSKARRVAKEAVEEAKVKAAQVKAEAEEAMRRKEAEEKIEKLSTMRAIQQQTDRVMKGQEAQGEKTRSAVKQSESNVIQRIDSREDALKATLEGFQTQLDGISASQQKAERDHVGFQQMWGESADGTIAKKLWETEAENRRLDAENRKLRKQQDAKRTAARKSKAPTLAPLSDSTSPLVNIPGDEMGSAVASKSAKATRLARVSREKAKEIATNGRKLPPAPRRSALDLPADPRRATRAQSKKAAAAAAKK